MPKLAQRFCFDLADALTGDGEALAYLFERVLAAILEAEAQAVDFFLSRRKAFQHSRCLFMKI